MEKELFIFFDIANKNDRTLILVLFCLLVTVLLLSVFAIIIYFYFKRTKNKYLNNLEKQASVIFNYTEKKVSITYFSDLNERKEISFEQFLNYFPYPERSKIDNWLKEVLISSNLDTNPVSVFLSDAAILKNRNNQNLKKTKISRICFWATGANKKEEIVYTHVVEFRFLPSLYNNNKKSLEHKELYSYDEVKRLFSRGLFTHGVIMEIKFDRFNNLHIPYNPYFFQYVVLNEIYKRENSIKHFVPNEAFIFFKDDNPYEIYLALKKTKYETNYRLERLLIILEKKFRKIFETMGTFSTNHLSLVAAKCSLLSNNFDKNIETLNNLIKLLREDKKSTGVYRNDNGFKDNIEDSYNLEISKLIKNSLIDIMFLPVYKVAKVRVLLNGYIARPVPIKSAFENITDARKYATKNSLNKELSSLIAKKTIPTYINQRENITSKLYYPIVLDELGFISRSISRMSNVDTVNFAFVINSQEIAEKEHDKDVFKDILNLQEKGFEFYLQIKRGDFILKNASFEAFDGYLVDAKLNNNVKMDSREYLNAYGLIDKLASFNKPVVSINTNSWAEVEALLKTGISLFASNVINEESQMPLGISKKNSKKLLNMYKK